MLYVVFVFLVSMSLCVFFCHIIQPEDKLHNSQHGAVFCCLCFFVSMFFCVFFVFVSMSLCVFFVTLFNLRTSCTIISMVPTTVDLLSGRFSTALSLPPNAVPIAPKPVFHSNFNFQRIPQKIAATQNCYYLPWKQNTCPHGRAFFYHSPSYLGDVA